MLRSLGNSLQRSAFTHVIPGLPRGISTEIRAFPVFQPKKGSFWAPLNPFNSNKEEAIDTKGWTPTNGKLRLPNGDLREVEVFQTEEAGWVQAPNLFNFK